MPSRKKQKQRSRRSIAMQKGADKMTLLGLQRSAEISLKKMLYSFNGDISQKEVNDKEKWIEDFKPIYEKALSNPNKKNKMIVKKYIREVYAFAELKMRYDRNKKVNDLLSQLVLPRMSNSLSSI